MPCRVSDAVFWAADDAIIVAAAPTSNSCRRIFISSAIGTWQKLNCHVRSIRVVAPILLRDIVPALPSTCVDGASQPRAGGADFSLSAAQGRLPYTCVSARGRTKENR